MRIKISMIDKDLRAVGILFNIICKTFTESRFRLINKLTKLVKTSRRSSNFNCSEEWITRKDGSSLRICVFRPVVPEKDVPGVLWLHGGGYAIGTPEQVSSLAERLIEARNCIVIAPDYRLSVEAPYPAALEDSYEALLWMKNHAKELGIRDTQIMVGGYSAGGGLAAALTLYARDEKEVNIAFQMPLYPMLDDRMSSISASQNNAPVWNSVSNQNAWKLYLDNIFGTDKVPAYAAPSRATDLSNLPPAVTFVGSLEPFRDETALYVKNLRKSGVPVEFKIFKSCYHAFEQICPKAKISQKAISFFIGSFKNAVDNYYAGQNNLQD